MSWVRLSFGDRVEISAGVEAGLGVREIARLIIRHPSIVSREIARNENLDRGFDASTAHARAGRRCRRPQAFKVAADEVLLARVRWDLRRSRTQREIAGRLRNEAIDPRVRRMGKSPGVDRKTVPHESIYRYIYALPKRELAASGIMLRSKRTRRRPQRQAGERFRLAGMVSIDAHDPSVLERRVPGHLEGDLVTGKGQQTAVATLAECTTRFTVIKALPKAKDSIALKDILIEEFNELPALMH